MVLPGFRLTEASANGQSCPAFVLGRACDESDDQCLRGGWRAGLRAVGVLAAAQAGSASGRLGAHTDGPWVAASGVAASGVARADGCSNGLGRRASERTRSPPSTYTAAAARVVPAAAAGGILCSDVCGQACSDGHSWSPQLYRSEGWLSRSFLGLAFFQILADFSSCFALGLLLQQWAVDAHVPTAMVWGYTITASGFVLLFGPASVVAAFKRAGERTHSAIRASGRMESRIWICRHIPCQAPRTGQGHVKRVAAGCFGGAMLLGLVYIAVGAVLLAIGSDVSCTGFTGTTEREWQAQCDWPRGRCVTGACVDFSNRAALLAFKASGNGDGLGSWVNGSNPCVVAWAGVTCGGGVVTQLHRDPATAASSLTGDVGQLAALSQLTVLSLSSTAVSGDVGPLAVLAQLTDLGLYNTAVSGDVGPLAALTRLTFLDLGGTNVTGCPLRLANGKSCIVATVASRARLHLSE